MNATSVRNETALVAGGSRGLGLLVARELAERGYRVHVCARDAEELARGAALLAREGLHITTAVCDVTDANAVARWVESAADDDAPISVAIAVAGVIQVGSIEAATPEMFDEAVDIMTKGPAYLALAVLPGMRARRRGRIGIVSSIGGALGVPHLVPYCTAKFGAAGLGQSLHAELGGTGVTVTTAFPPPMRTGSHLHATFSGNRTAEYAWFAPAASIPVLSLNARTAARRIVEGTLAGKPVLGLSPISHVAMRAQGVAPATVARALSVVSRLLPTGSQRPRAGRDVRRERANPVVDTLTAFGDRTARRTNEDRAAETDPA